MNIITKFKHSVNSSEKASQQMGLLSLEGMFTARNLNALQLATSVYFPTGCCACELNLLNPADCYEIKLNINI